MTVYEADVPGVGRKFELEVGNGERLVVVIHHDGKRDIYRRSDPDADSEHLVSLSDDQARKFGAILEGAYFQPVALEDVKVPLGEAIIEWHTVAQEAAIVGETLEDFGVRRQTGASVVAVQRGEETIPNPPADTVVESGDTLVALGTREEQSNLGALLADGE